MSATVSEKAGHWFVSVQVEQEVPEPKAKPEAIVGVDLGIKSLAVCSDGKTFENPKALRSRLAQLKHLQQHVSRKVKGSNNRKKAARKVARLHLHISNIRKDCLHQITTALTTNHANCKVTEKDGICHCSCGAWFVSNNSKIMKVEPDYCRIDSNGGSLCQSKTQKNEKSIRDDTKPNGLQMDCVSAENSWSKEPQDAQTAGATNESICCNYSQRGESLECASNAEIQLKTIVNPVQNVSKKAETTDKCCGSPLLSPMVKPVPVAGKKNKCSSVSTTSTMTGLNTENNIKDRCISGSETTTIQKDSKHCAGTAIRQSTSLENVHIKTEEGLPETSHLTKTKSVVVIEDLNVSGMMKNHCLAQAIQDLGLGEFRRQMDYKGIWNGCKIVAADRYFPSSKLCSACGCVNDALTLADREWTCACGKHHDRDRNASTNLENYGRIAVASSVKALNSPMEKEALTAA